jgi:hypothetical protein
MSIRGSANWGCSGVAPEMPGLAGWGATSSSRVTVITLWAGGSRHARERRVAVQDWTETFVPARRTSAYGKTGHSMALGVNDSCIYRS